MSRSYFETLSQTKKVASSLKAKLEDLFVNDGYKDDDIVTKTDEIGFEIYDLIDCVQQSMWLIVRVVKIANFRL